MSLPTMTDEALMQAYCAGDTAAFDALYSRHEGALFRFVRRTLGVNLAAQADDVFQDCWLRIIRARASFSPELGRWSTWAYAVAHHLALDRLRVAGREVRLPDSAPEAAHEGPDALDWLQTAWHAHGPSVEDHVHWRAAGEQMLQCLEHLPPAQRAAFLLHHEDGATLEELASALGVGFQTMKSRVRYALQKLKTCMQPYLHPSHQKTATLDAASAMGTTLQEPA